MKTRTFEEKSSEILSVLSNSFRIRLIFALNQQEACVCHLEALLGKRQAYISQHLMALRNIGLLDTRRDGKFVYYQLADPRIIDLIKDAALISGVDLIDIPKTKEQKTIKKCICPHCLENVDKSSQKNSKLDLESV